MYLIQHYVINFDSDFRSVAFYRYSGFLPNKTDRHDIAEILLKVALNTLNIFSDVSLNDRLPIIQKQISMKYNTTKLYSIIPYSKLNYLYNSYLEIQIRIRIQSMLMQLLRYILFDHRCLWTGPYVAPFFFFF
jgi:hypothetical protein